MTEFSALKEAIKDRSTEQLEKFLGERNNKSIDPILDMNLKCLNIKEGNL